MNPMLRALLLCVLLLSPPAVAAERLPMPVLRYAELCQASGGTLTTHLTSGVGIVRCGWPEHGRTECKVGSNIVNICGISCQSNACLKENPARYTPTWPLAGGPGSGTLSPSN
jgi:hypothetical protein